MLIACWSVKGGSGTSVVAAALALQLARSGDTTLVDMGGDAPAILGLPEPDGPGVSEWLAAGNVDAGGLSRVSMSAAPGLRLVPLGREPLPESGGERLAAALAGPANVVIDCGSRIGTGPGLGAASAASISLLVVRPCYLALRRAISAPLRPSGLVIVDEGERSLGQTDVAEVLGVPVRAVIPWDPRVARAVDAGLLVARMPRSLRTLEAAA